MKLTLLLILCWCLCTLVYADSVAPVTKPAFVRSRYSLRWRKTSTSTTPSATTAAVAAVTTSTEHPQAASSTASSDYDYYGNGEADNLVHK